MAKAMLIDISKCMGCRACQVACKQWNELPAVETKQEGTYENPPELSASTWTRVLFIEGDGEWIFRKHQCMHCTEASCVNVCPTGAIHKEGPYVVVDQDWCIGCGYCVQACPFGAVHREPPMGTARKCWFCLDRVTNGMEPACAKACPTGAIQFGEREDLIAAAHLRVAELRSNGHPQAQLYGEKELGGLYQMYVLTKPPSEVGLPESPRVATSSVPYQWLSGLIAAGTIAAVPFWLLFNRKKKLEEESSNVGGKE